MIILGDLASPSSSSTDILRKNFAENPSLFSDKRIICNFEGLLYDGPAFTQNEPVLYNHSSVLDLLNPHKASLLCLANNHILDLPGQFIPSREKFQKDGFLFCGAGTSKEESETPVIFKEGGETFALYNACWDFLLYNHKNPRSGIHVAEIQELKLIQEIKEYKQNHPGTSIIVYVHWSLDLETLPFPMYRQFSRALIDAGAKLVAGVHSHCIQGGESYKNGYIIYGMGNFYIPDKVYAGGNLQFPEFSKSGLVLEWDTEKKEMLCHWFENDSGIMNFTKSEEFNSSLRLKEFSPYTGMSEQEYLKYYKQYRRKKILIPVYRDYTKTFRNNLYTRLLKTRARSARFLAKLNFIKWQN